MQTVHGLRMRLVVGVEVCSDANLSDPRRLLLRAMPYRMISTSTNGGTVDTFVNRCILVDCN